MMKRQPSAKNNLPPTKVVNIPLLFKNCSIEVTTPSRKLIYPRSSRGASSMSKGIKASEKSSSKKSTPRGWGAAVTETGTAKKRETLNGKKVIKIDLKRNPSKQRLEQQHKPVELEAYKNNEQCKSHSRMKTSLPTKSSLPTEPSEATCLTYRTFIEQTLTQTQQLPLRKPTRVNSSQDLRVGASEEISTEISTEVISHVKISELHELRERFIKKRSEVYQVLCNLDSKFEKLDKEYRLPTVLREVDTNGKRQIENMLRQRTSPRSPALFTHGVNHPINSLLVGRRNQEMNAIKKQQ